MKYLLTTIKNLEFITEKEIKGSKKIQDEVLEINTTKKEIEKIIKKSQSIIKVYKLIKKIDFKNLEDLMKQIKKIDFSKIKEPFIVRTEKKRKYLTKSLNIEQDIGTHIYTKYNKKVNFKEPKTKVVLLIKEKTCYVTEEITNQRLSKRKYRIHTTRNSTIPLIAYAIIKIAKWKSKEILLDPFCNTGEIVIEAALFKKNQQIIAMDSNKYSIKKAKFNATVAEVQNKIKFKNLEADWIDTKFKKGEIDKIITHLPSPSKMFRTQDLKRIYSEFFNQAKHILKEKGTITLLLTKKELLKDYIKDYKIIKRVEPIVGENKFHIIQLKKNI